MKPLFRLTTFLFLSAPAFCAPTTVAQSMLNPDGTLASGTALIRITAPCKSGSSYVGDKTISVRFTGGAFSVSLVPNDSCVPGGTSYTVAWLLLGGTTRTQTWVVPTSGSPVTVDSVIVSTAPIPAVPQINPSQIAQAGATSNQALCWSGTSWGPGTCGGGGGGGGSVASVFTRTGAIVAVSGDYTAAQVTNAVDSTASYANPAWITSLAYAKITGVPTFAVTKTPASHQWLASYDSTTGAFTQTQPAASDVTNAVDSTGSYSNPSWITALAYAKITGVPTFAATTAAVSHQWLRSYDASTGAFTQTQPAAADISGLAASATTDATNASNISSGTLPSAQLPAAVKIRSCELHLFPITSETLSCYNDYGVTTTITAVRCYADTGSPTIRPIVTGGSSTSILSGDLTCGTASWANGSLNGAPTRASAGTVDANVVSASTANWIRIVITETLP